MKNIVLDVLKCAEETELENQDIHDNSDSLKKDIIDDAYEYQTNRRLGLFKEADTNGDDLGDDEIILSEIKRDKEYER